MKRVVLFTLTVGLLSAIPAVASAQTPQASWTQGSAATAAQAQGFTYRLYVTPAGGSTQDAPVSLTGVTCTGTTAPFPCTGTVPAPEAAKVLLTGAKSTLTAQDTAGGTTESLPSAPFTAGAGVPTALKIQ